jgi:small subunit ribosomal protein S20
MPISLSAKKSLRKSLKNRKENVSWKYKIREVIKSFKSKPSSEGLKKVYSALDKAKKKGLFHKNKVARLKSEFSKKVSGKKEAVVEKKLIKKVAVKKVVAKKKVSKKTVKKMS